MTGWTTHRKPNGIRIYVGFGANFHGSRAVQVDLFLDEDECKQLKETLIEAEKLWRKKKHGK